MDTNTVVYSLPNGIQKVTTSTLPKGTGTYFEQVVNEYNNGMKTVRITQESADSTIVSDTLYFSTGESEFIETETSGNYRRVSTGTYDSDLNLTSLENMYYRDNLLTEVNKDENVDGNYEYQALYNQGSLLSEYFDEDSDGFVEYETHYNPDGTISHIDNRGLGEKISDFFSGVF